MGLWVLERDPAALGQPRAEEAAEAVRAVRPAGHFRQGQKVQHESGTPTAVWGMNDLCTGAVA